MASKIEWTDETWNPLAGCSPVSEGCRNCYAARDANRLAGNPNSKVAQAYRGTAEMRGLGKGRRAVFTGRINLLHDRLDQPLRWQKPRRVFVNSMSDLFHEEVPFWFIDRVFAVMALADKHTFQILTKRPERAVEYFEYNSGGRLTGGTLERVAGMATIYASQRGEDVSHPYWDMWLEKWPLPHIWIGTSVEDQAALDERVSHLLDVPAAVRWLSMEPLLGPVTFANRFWMPTDEPVPESSYWLDGLRRLDWIVVGGESGHGARAMHPDWVHTIQAECEEAGVPFFFKQWGAWKPIRPLTREEWTLRGGDPRFMDFSPWEFDKVGKKAAGRELHGRTYDAYPVGKKGQT